LEEVSYWDVALGRTLPWPLSVSPFVLYFLVNMIGTALLCYVMHDGLTPLKSGGKTNPSSLKLLGILSQRKVTNTVHVCICVCTFTIFHTTVNYFKVYVLYGIQ
jgi:hypothetical protein